jgi:hypothetical protein
MSIWESIAGAIERDPVPILGIIFGCTAGVLVVVAGAWAKAWSRVRAAEAEASLKQDMIARGMNADEIERVIRVTGPSARDSSGRR